MSPPLWLATQGRWSWAVKENRLNKPISSLPPRLLLQFLSSGSFDCIRYFPIVINTMTTITYKRKYLIGLRVFRRLVFMMAKQKHDNSSPLGSQLETKRGHTRHGTRILKPPTPNAIRLCLPISPSSTGWGSSIQTWVSAVILQSTTRMDYSVAVSESQANPCFLLQVALGHGVLSQQ